MPEPGTAIERELRALLGDDAVRSGDTAAYRHDATEARALQGRADAVALPADAEQVAATVAWCYAHDVAIVPRGGGTGLAGGAVPDGGVVLTLERLDRVRAFAPERWRMQAEAGVRTAEVARRAREHGLLFAPDPGASESSLIGGNIATNAGGPHSFKYGVTGRWVTGLEMVLAPGELVSIGGPVRKDVAGYDLAALMIGSEGTLGVVTAAWLALIPAPEAELPVLAAYPDARAGAAALGAVLAAGLVPATLEYLDAGALAAARGQRPDGIPADAGFLLIAEADGSAAEAKRLRAELLEVLGDGASATVAPTARSEVRALWRWRSGVSHAVAAQRGGKISEDIVVPSEHLAQAVDAIGAIGARHGLATCSWGHAGDGNLHATFMIDRTDPEQLRRAQRAAQDLFALAVELGGSVSGEHGLGLVKRGALARQWAPAALAAHAAIKAALDPKGLLNPGKKLAR